MIKDMVSVCKALNGDLYVNSFSGQKIELCKFKTPSYEPKEISLMQTEGEKPAFNIQNKSGGSREFIQLL